MVNLSRNEEFMFVKLKSLYGEPRPRNVAVDGESL